QGRAGARLDSDHRVRRGAQVHDRLVQGQPRLGEHDPHGRLPEVLREAVRQPARLLTRDRGPTMTVKRGVILAGGKGTRLGELTKVTNKHLLPVGPFPMVYHPLKKMAGAGLSDVLLVSGTEHMGDFVELLGSGKDNGCRLTYRVQDEAGGIAQALSLAELFC